MKLILKAKFTSKKKVNGKWRYTYGEPKGKTGVVSKKEINSLANAMLDNYHSSGLGSNDSKMDAIYDYFNDNKPDDFNKWPKSKQKKFESDVFDKFESMMPDDDYYEEEDDEPTEEEKAEVRKEAEEDLVGSIKRFSGGKITESIVNDYLDQYAISNFFNSEDDARESMKKYIK